MSCAPERASRSTACLLIGTVTLLCESGRSCCQGETSQQESFNEHVCETSRSGLLPPPPTHPRHGYAKRPLMVTVSHVAVASMTDEASGLPSALRVTTQTAGSATKNRGCAESPHLRSHGFTKFQLRRTSRSFNSVCSFIAPTPVLPGHQSQPAFRS